MKRLITMLAAVCFLGVAASAQVGFGAGLSLFDSDYFGIQAKLIYDIEENSGKPLEIHAKGTYYFENDNVGVFTIDGDAHWRLLTLGENVNFAPFAGLNWTRVSVDIGGVSGSDSEIGLNLGGSFEFPISDRLIYAEPKIIIAGAEAFVISAGVRF